MSRYPAGLNRILSDSVGNFTKACTLIIFKLSSEGLQVLPQVSRKIINKYRLTTV